MILTRSLTSAVCVLGLTCVAAAQSPLIMAPRQVTDLTLPTRGIDVPLTNSVPALVPPTTETLPQPTLVPQSTFQGNAGTYSGQVFNSPGVIVGEVYSYPGSGGIEPAPLSPYTEDGYLRNAGAHLAVPPPLGLIAPQATSGGLHQRYPYYSYRRPWYPAGPASQNVTIVW